MGRKTVKHSAAVILFIISLSPVGLWAQPAKPATLAELAVYNGPDREQLLAAGAKKEGKIVWYTALAGGSYKDLARAFEAKYGVPVEAYRGASRDLIAKVLAESQAKKYLMDVAESSLPLLMLMREMKRLTPFYVPHLAKFSADAKEDAGKGAVFWATDRESYMGFAYNKDKLPANAVPKNYEGLLNPALKGRMSFVTTDTGSRTVGAMLRTKGEEYLEKAARARYHHALGFRPSAQRHDHFRRGRSVADDLSQSRVGSGGEESAGGLGAHGHRAGERGQRCALVAGAASPCGGVVHRFSFQSRRPENLGRLRVRQRH